MKEFKISLVVTATLALVVACGPKSRYRAKDFVEATFSTAKTPAKSVVSPMPADMVNINSAPAPETPEAKATLENFEYLGVVKSVVKEGFKINIYSINKTDNVLRVTEVDGQKDSLNVQKISKVKSNDSLETELDTAASKEAVATEVVCKNDKCEEMEIKLGKAKLLVRAETKNYTKKVSNSTEALPKDGKLKSLIGAEVRIQRSAVAVGGVRFDTLTVAGADMPVMVFGLEDDKKEAQKLKVIMGKQLGIETADYIAYGDKDADKFSLTLKGKDGTLAELKFEPVGEAAAEVAACGTKDPSDSIRLTCSKQANPEGVRSENLFAVKVDMNRQDNTSKVLRYRSESDDWTKNQVALKDGENSKVISSLQAKDLGKLTFSLKADAAATSPEASIVLSDVCCKESYRIETD